MEFFNLIWLCENEGNFKRKQEIFNELYQAFKNGDFDEYISFLNTTSTENIKKFQNKLNQNELTKPSYAGFCEVYSLQDLPRIKADKKALLLHSIAHIEYSAIDIALDSACAFAGLPREYYANWLEVADDEMRHFGWLCAMLEKYGLKYGDLPVHNGLFVATKRTRHSLLDKMAILPRHMEANGLDSNLNLREKMSANDELKPILERIASEEITHVIKGDKWFKYACIKEGINPVKWLDIVLSYYPKAFNNSRRIDESSRLKCGFSSAELANIKALGQQSKQNSAQT